MLHLQIQSKLYVLAFQTKKKKSQKFQKSHFLKAAKREIGQTSLTSSKKCTALLCTYYVFNV